MMRRRRGNLFALVLLFLLVTVVLAGIVQLQVVQNARQDRAIAVGDDALQRAEGIVRLVLSRWKKRVQYQSLLPLNISESGADPVGSWDGHRFELGWKLAPVPGARSEHLACIWVRFPDETPPLTWRFDVRIGSPTLIRPAVARIVGVAPDTVAPLLSAERNRAFAPRLAAAAAPVDESWMELSSRRIQAAGAAGADPVSACANLAPAQLGLESQALGECVRAVRDSENALESAVKVGSARLALAAAARLPETDRRPWLHLARYVAADALAAEATSLGGPQRIARLAEAVDLLRSILNDRPSCCGAALVAWRLATVLARSRADLDASGQFSDAWRTALDELRQVANAAPRDPIHDDTDITRDELPRLFGLLWRSRVAVGLSGPSSYLLVSMLQDGTSPVVHLESSAPLAPLGWDRDGSHILAASGFGARGDGLIPSSPGAPPPQWYRVSLDGERLEPFARRVPFMGQPQTDEPIAGNYWNDAGTVEASEDGSAYTVSGTFTCTSQGVRLQGTVVVHDGRSAMPKSTGNEDSFLPVVVYPRFPEGLHFLGDPTKVVIVRTPDVTQIPFANRLPNIATLTGLRHPFRIGGVSPIPGLGAPWIGFTAPTPTALSVYFLNLASGEIQTHPIAGVPTPSTHPDRLRSGVATRSPPGYLVAAGSRLVHLAAPGLPPAQRELPLGLAGQLGDICDVSSAPWGGTVYFTAVHDSARRTFAMDLASGSAVVLTGVGSVSTWDHPSTRIAVSPLPELVNP